MWWSYVHQGWARQQLLVLQHLTQSNRPNKVQPTMDSVVVLMIAWIMSQWAMHCQKCRPAQPRSTVLSVAKSNNWKWLSHRQHLWHPHLVGRWRWWWQWHWLSALKRTHLHIPADFVRHWRLMWALTEAHRINVRRTNSKNYTIDGV